MRALISTTIIALTMILPTVIRAEGLLYRLPEDGASVRFDMVGRVERRKEVAVVGDMTGSIKMSSVGKATVEGEECRWLEFKIVMKQEGRERTEIMKILIPEKHLKKGANPLEHVIRGWVKRQDDDPQELKNPVTGILKGLLTGKLKETKKLKKKTIESKLGKLQCEGLTGIKEYKKSGRDIRIIYDTRLHDKAPFGVVTLQLQTATKQNGQRLPNVTLHLKLADVAANAISALPDSQ